MNRLIMKTGCWLMVLVCLLMTSKTVTIANETSEGNHFRQVSSSSVCDHLGHCDILIFECTVVGGLATVWRGTAFSCENSNDEIVLLHSRFVNGTTSTCNNGSIVAMGQEVTTGDDTYYTSQLSITVTFDVIGKNIECLHDDHENTNTTATVVLGSFTIPPITAPPNGLRISHIDISLIQLTFSWFGSPVASDFTEFNYLYNILASNCGSCPTTTNYTTVTCIDVPTNGSTCMLAVQTIVCTEFNDTGCTIGNSSDSISIKILNTRHSHNMIGDLTTDTMLIASIVFLVASLTTCSAVSFLVIATLLTTNRARIKSAFIGLWLMNGTSSTAAHGTEGTYDDVKNPSRSIRLSTISTRHNVAYGQKQAVSTAAVADINNNPAYNIIV